MGKKPKGQAPKGYEVGHGKPPRHTRFQPGQSGNPGGRKKETLNNKTVLERVLNDEVVVSGRGKARTVTMREALVLRCAQSGMAGNQRAIEFLLEMADYLDSLNHVQTDELEEEDEALLDAAMLARQGSVGSDGANEIDPDDLQDPGNDDDNADGASGRPRKRPGNTDGGGRS